MFHHLYTRATEPYYLTPEAHQNARRVWLCNGCSQPKPEVEAVDVVVQNSRISNAALNIVFGAGVGVARLDFLMAFGAKVVHRDLQLGRVYRANGTVIEEIVTFRGRQKVIVRGTKEAGFRVCGQCGRIIYYAEFGDRYLYPEPPSGKILESNLWGVVTSDELFHRAISCEYRASVRQPVIKIWRKLTHEELPVICPPPDGFGELRVP